MSKSIALIIERRTKMLADRLARRNSIVLRAFGVEEGGINPQEAAEMWAVLQVAQREQMLVNMSPEQQQMLLQMLEGQNGS